MRDGPTSVVVLPIERVQLVVDARRVRAIEDETSADASRRDLAAMIGVEVGATEGARRAIQVDGGAWLVGAERVVVRRVEGDAFRPLPAWLDALRERLAIASLVVLESGYGFELDVDRIGGAR